MSRAVSRAAIIWIFRTERGRVLKWLDRYWVAGAAFMAGGFICLLPLMAALLPLPVLLIYLHTPGYMIHQNEEHYGDRFRRFTNAHMFGGREALRTVDVLVVNLPVVWGLNLGALYAAALWGAGYGLVAPYLMLINAITHGAAAVKLRSYNPGTVSAAVLFVPLSLVTLSVVGSQPQVTLHQHAVGFGLALLVHLLIVAQAFRRLRALRSASLR